MTYSSKNECKIYITYLWINEYLSVSEYMLFIWYLLNIDKWMTVWSLWGTSDYIFCKCVRNISHVKGKGWLNLQLFMNKSICVIYSHLKKYLRNIKHLLIELWRTYELNESVICCDLGENKCDKFMRCLWYLINMLMIGRFWQSTSHFFILE